MVTLSGVVEGVVSNAAFSTLVGWGRRLLGDHIRITSPRPQEMLADPKPVGGGTSYAVRGTLKRIPKGHKIWLLTQDPNGRVWPQGFEEVQHDVTKGEWSGRIMDRSGKATRIIAVVAPPTSNDLFTYFQACGPKTGFAPLPRVPLECRYRDEVQARVP